MDVPRRTRVFDCTGGEERQGPPVREDDPGIRQASEVLRAGGLVAFPTETVYGLGADATNAVAVEAVFAAKGRPADNPLIVHIADPRQLDQVAEAVPPYALRLARQFWPGPLTLVLPARRELRGTVTRGLETVAVRMPDHPVALALLRRCRLPVAAPSANLSGRPSPTTAQHVLHDLEGKVEVLLDGGPCRVGIESTVLDLSVTPPRLLRPGAVTRRELEAVLGTPVLSEPGAGPPPGADPDRPPLPPDDRGEAAGDALRSPGLRYRHYTPAVPVVVVEREVEAAALVPYLRRLAERFGTVGWLAVGRPEEELEALLGDALGGELRDALRLVHREDPESLTRHLFADLRDLDAAGTGVVLVDAVEEAAPVMDRVRRAAARRIGPGDLAADPPGGPLPALEEDRGDEAG